MGIETAFLIASVIGTAASLDQQNKARRASQRQMAAEQRKADIENVRQARESVRRARLAQASIINQGAVSGTLMGSGVAGGVSSVGSQMAGNLGFMSDIAKENTTIFSMAQQGAKASANAAIYGQIGELGMKYRTIFSQP
jgi:hypothetical protein